MSDMPAGRVHQQHKSCCPTFCLSAEPCSAAAADDDDVAMVRVNTGRAHQEVTLDLSMLRVVSLAAVLVSMSTDARTELQDLHRTVAVRMNS
jgi:hypothetical protein